MKLPVELPYVGLFALLFVVPKVVQRIRVPSAITALLFGAVAGNMGWFADDPTVGLLSKLGIVALFLFAGLEVDVEELRKHRGVLTQHLLLLLAMLGGAAFALMATLPLSGRAASVLALALMVPSTGFILDSLAVFKLRREQRGWVRTTAIISEIFALVALFVVLQSTSVTQLVAASGALVALIVAVPAALRAYDRWVAPFAPGSEFPFLLLVAVIAASVTKELGVYYLVGAFIVGVAAHWERQRIPALTSERMMHAVEAFASVFIPFYFFKAGSLIRMEALDLRAALLGAAFVVIVVPLRVGIVTAHRRLALGESLGPSSRVATALVPTLVFSLVLGEILVHNFAAPDWIFGGVVLYTITNTTLPGVLLRIPPPEYEAPHLATVPSYVSTSQDDATHEVPTEEALEQAIPPSPPPPAS